jgi:hypothetical protein
MVSLVSLGLGFDLTFGLHRDIRISAVGMGLFNEQSGFPDQLFRLFQFPFSFLDYVHRETSTKQSRSFRGCQIQSDLTNSTRAPAAEESSTTKVNVQSG